MATDYLYIGSTPCDEDCAQTGKTIDAFAYNYLECKAYIVALEKYYGAPPQGARFAIKSEQHDAGRYCEVIIRYDLNSEEAIDYAYKVEVGLITWAQAGILPPVRYDSNSQAIAA